MVDLPKAKDPRDVEGLRAPATPTPEDAAAAAASDAAPAAAAPSGAAVDAEAIKSHAVAILRHVFDPEIPVNIYDLGLIYGIDVAPDGVVDVKMTLTSPMCPAAGSLPPEVQYKVASIEGVKEVRVDLVWDPPWDKDRMSEDAKLQLGMM